MWFIHTLRITKRHTKNQSSQHNGQCKKSTQKNKVNTKKQSQHKKTKQHKKSNQHKNNIKINTKNITPNTSPNTSHPTSSDIIGTYQTTMKQLRSIYQNPKSKSKTMSLQQNINSYRIDHAQTSVSISTNRIIHAQRCSLQINQPTKNHIKIASNNTHLHSSL